MVRRTAALILAIALGACGPSGGAGANKSEAATGATAGNDMAGDEAANLSGDDVGGNGQ